MFSSPSDCCLSLPDVQSLEKCCFICFILFFSYFWWEGKSGLCYSVLAGNPAATFEALSHQSTLAFREGAGTSSSSCLAGIGFLVHTVHKTILPTASFSLPTTLHFHTLFVSKEWKNPCNQLWTIFFGNLFLHLVAHFDVFYLFYWNVSLVMEGDNIHRAWHVTGVRDFTVIRISQISPAHDSNK